MDDILLGLSSADSQTKGSVPLSYAALREKLKSVNSDSLDQAGNTLLHRLADYQGLPTPIFILAAHGVPVNHLNEDGESALHLAVRADNPLMSEALLQCGADLNITDKVGTSPMDLCSSEMRGVVARFRPGLRQAALAGDFSAVCRLLKNWVSVTSRTLTDGQSMLELTKTKVSDNIYVLKCLQKIRDSQTQSMLIHAVLSDDAETVRALLENTRMRTTNCRFKREVNLLSIAIENKNYEIIRLLLTHGVKTNGRVRHRKSLSADSIPCVLLAYSNTPDVRVAQLFWDFGIHALHERDKAGNSSLMRSILHDASPEFIQWYVNRTAGQTLHKRNVEKLTAYEIAESGGRTDVTSILHQYVNDHFERMSYTLMAQFYGSLHPRLEGMCHQIESNANELFQASRAGDIGAVIKYNTMNYQDTNGHTVLHNAVAAAKVNVIKGIGRSRPVLKGISDNYGRYPLHIAFLLPDDDVRKEILSILLESNAESYEFTSDKDGLNPADYLKLDEEMKLSICQSVLDEAC